MKNSLRGILDLTHASKSRLLKSHLLPILFDGRVPPLARSYSAVFPICRYRAVSSTVIHSSAIFRIPRYQTVPFAAVQCNRYRFRLPIQLQGGGTSKMPSRNSVRNQRAVHYSPPPLDTPRIIKP